MALWESPSLGQVEMMDLGKKKLKSYLIVNISIHVLIVSFMKIMTIKETETDLCTMESIPKLLRDYSGAFDLVDIIWL